MRGHHRARHQVIADFGDVPPFSHIREAEARHIEALRSVLIRHGKPVPENPWVGRVSRYASVQEASQQRHLRAFERCAAGRPGPGGGQGRGWRGGGRRGP